MAYQTRSMDQDRYSYNGPGTGSWCNKNVGLKHILFSWRKFPLMMVYVMLWTSSEVRYGSVKLAVPGVGTADDSSRVPRPMLCPSGLAQHWPYYGTTVRRPPSAPRDRSAPSTTGISLPSSPCNRWTLPPPTITLRSPKVIIMLHYDNSTPPNHN